MRESIAATLGDVFFSDLSAHIARDAVIVVSTELDLIDVGMALGTNDVRAVEAWIKSGQIHKPSAEDLSRWPLVTNLRFKSVVVQPFVLVHKPNMPAAS